MNRLDLPSRVRRMLAAVLERLPWTCDGMLAVWELHGGWRALREALRPKWVRVCMADAVRNGACFCGRYGVVEGSRYVYRATRVERGSLAGVLEAWEREEVRA